MSTITLDYQPLPVHYPFHQSKAYERTVFGGYGSGKSWAICAEALAVGLEQPGSEILVCRKTVPALRDTTEAIFVSLIPKELWDACKVAKMGGHYESITLPNGTKYLFRGVDDWMKLKSLNLAFIFFDEVDEFSQEDYLGLMSRVRQTRALGSNQRITRRGMVSASNPAGHNWVWRRFVSAEATPNSSWFKSTSLDNPHLPLDYIEQLLAMPDPWVRRYVLCEFDDFGGQVYESWGYDTHVVKPYRSADGYAYDPAGMFVMGFDPGTSSGNAALWCYYDRAKHRLVGIAEYNEKGIAADAHARAWRQIEARHKMRVSTRIADPKAIPVRDRGSNMTLADQYRRLGFNFQHGTNAVETRLTSLGQLIHQGRFVVTEDCPMTFEQIQNYRWEDLTPLQREKGREAKPLKRDVDLVDAAQYIACRYITPPSVQPARDPREQHEHEIRTAIRRQIAAQRSATPSHDLGTIPV